MVVRMRSTKSHTGHRRSHHALALPRLSRCPDCGKEHLRHRMCKHCGKYRGRLIIDMPAMVSKRTEKRKARLKSLGKGGKDKS